jgi:hypothetical protein
MREKIKTDCSACRLTRVFLLLAVPIMMMMWLKPELPLLNSINLTYAFANLVGFACACVVAYKAYREFWLPARKATLNAIENTSAAIQTEKLEIVEPSLGIKTDTNADIEGNADISSEAEAKLSEKNLN